MLRIQARYNSLLKRFGPSAPHHQKLLCRLYLQQIEHRKDMSTVETILDRVPAVTLDRVVALAIFIEVTGLLHDYARPILAIIHVSQGPDQPVSCNMLNCVN